VIVKHEKSRAQKLDIIVILETKVLARNHLMHNLRENRETNHNNLILVKNEMTQDDEPQKLKHVNLEIQRENHLPLPLHSDPLQLLQVIMFPNLSHNSEI
jgi:hypothetical protein